MENFIQSVLNQTEQDFELIFIDDCSTDNNVEIINKYTDNRIKLIQHSYNKGINSGLNDGINAASSCIIAATASDDILAPDYAEKVLKEFENPEVGVVYVGLQYIDENGHYLLTPDNLLPVNSTKYEILYKSFILDNQVVSPGMAYRKSAVMPFLPLNTGLLLFTDSEMHMLLMLYNNVSFVNQPLVYYRMNLNSASHAHGYKIRRNAEVNMLLDSFTQHIDLNKFNEIFSSTDIAKRYKATNETLPYLLGRIALTSNNYDRKIWGYQKVASFISTKKNMDILHALYGFTFKDYMNLVNEFSELREYKLRSKLKQYRKRFKYTVIISVILAILCILLVIL